MSEFLLSASINEVEAGQVLTKERSRYVTVMQYFTLPEASEATFIEEAGDVAAGFSPFDVEGGEYVELGPGNDVPARCIVTLGRGATLRALHAVLGAVIEQQDGEISAPEWAYDGYNPHMTYRNGVAIEKGERATLRTLELSKKMPGGEKVIQNVWEFEEV